MFGLATELKYHWDAFLRLIYPAVCILCETPLLLEERYLCPDCAGKIRPLQPPACFKCARPFPPYGNHRSICNDCRAERPFYDRGTVLTAYEEDVKSILHQIKFYHRPWLLKIFEPLLSRLPAETFCAYDVIIPVPLDWFRELDRQFNQALLIAQTLKRLHPELGGPIRLLLKKVKKTMPQSRLGRSERLHNLTDAFRLARPKAVQNKKVLLVDDILTTGSTMNECAKTLKESEALEVDFFTLARAL